MPARIFIMDDDKELSEELVEILNHEGYFVKAEHDGLKGMELIEKGGYDLILLDLKLPGLSGFDILKKIREKNINIKIIIISGRPKNSSLFNKSKTNEEEDLLRFANEIISKPFNIKAMLNKIRELLI